MRLHIFGVTRTIDVLDLENQPQSGKIRTESGALGLKETSDTKSIYTKIEGFKNYLKYSFIRLLKISHCLRYRVPDPVLTYIYTYIVTPKSLAPFYTITY